jgi:hypothetical protein
MAYRVKLIVKAGPLRIHEEVRIESGVALDLLEGNAEQEGYIVDSYTEEPDPMSYLSVLSHVRAIQVAAGGR